MSKVKLLVTAEKFDEVFSIEDWFNFSSLSNKEIYDKMLQFVADSEGNPVSVEDARKLFKEVPKKEWIDYVSSFVKSVSEAFVNPTNGSS